MRAALLAVLLVTVAGCSHAPSPASLPKWRDLTIRTKTTVDDPRAPVQTMTHQFKGARKRNQFSMESGGSTHASSVYITQCDLQRTISLDEDARTVVVSPIPTAAMLARGFSGRGIPPPRPGTEDVTITMDSVDTGERRPFGTYVARHVVMTTTHERRRSPSDTSVDVRDGWYIDISPDDCMGGVGATAFVTASVLGGVAETTRFVQRGTAPLGLPLEEVQRHTDPYGAFTNRTVLLEFSEAPLGTQLFAVPSGYRRALPLPGGGYDPSRPDTVTNRAAVYWEAVGAWFASIVR